MASVREVLIKFLGDSSGVRKATGDADKGFKSLSDRLDHVRKSVGDADGVTGKLKAGWSAVGDAFGTSAGKMAVAGAGVAAVGVAAAKAVTEFQDTTLAVGEFRDATGTTSEEASRFVEVFDDLGVGADVGQAAIGRFAKALGSNTDAFAEFGVQVVRASDGTVDMAATFVNAVDALNRIKDPAQRAAAGAAMFGKGWQSMASIIESGAPALQQALESVQPSKVFTDADIQSGRDLRDAFDSLADAGEGLLLTLGKALAPAISKLAPIIAKLVDAAGPLVEAFGTTIAGALEAVAPLIEGITTVLGPLIVGLAKVIEVANGASIALSKFLALGDEIEFNPDEIVAWADAHGYLKEKVEGSTQALVDIQDPLFGIAQTSQEAADAIRDAADAAREQADAEADAAQYYDSRVDAAQAAEDQATAMAQLEASTRKQEFADREYREMAEGVTRAMDERARATEAAKQAQDALYAAEMGSIDAEFRQHDAMQSANEDIMAYAMATLAGTTSTADLADMQNKAAQSAFSAAEAAVYVAEQNAALSGTTLDVGQKLGVARQSMLDFANSMSADNPLKAQLIDIANRLTMMPDGTVAVSAPGAAEAKGDVEGVTNAAKTLDATDPQTNPQVVGSLTALTLLAYVQSAVDRLNATKIVITPQVNTGPALSALNAVILRASQAQTSAANAASAAVRSAQQASSAMQQIKAGSVYTP